MDTDIIENRILMKDKNFALGNEVKGIKTKSLRLARKFVIDKEKELAEIHCKSKGKRGSL